MGKYKLTDEDIANGVISIKNIKDGNEDSIEKPYGTFRGGVCKKTKIKYDEFNITTDAYENGDEVREMKTFKTEDTGTYLERSVWVSGYTHQEYVSLVDELNEKARKNDCLITSFNGIVRSYTADERANNFYNLSSADEKTKIDYDLKVNRIKDLKETLLREYSFVAMKQLVDKYKNNEWKSIKAEITSIIDEIEQLEEELGS